MKEDMKYIPLETIELKLEDGMWVYMSHSEFVKFCEESFNITQNEFKIMQEKAYKNPQKQDLSDITFWHYHDYYYSDIVRFRLGGMHNAVDLRGEILERVETEDPDWDKVKIRYYDLLEKKEKEKWILNKRGYYFYKELI